MYIHSPEFILDLQGIVNSDERASAIRLKRFFDRVPLGVKDEYLPNFIPEDNGRRFELGEAIEKAIQSPYAETSDDQPERIFTQEAAVVIISYEGKVLAQWENPHDPIGRIGRVHAEFGEGPEHTLLPYAYSKGAQRLHLEFTSRRGGIVARGNHDYLQSVLNEDHNPDFHLYEGDAAIRRYANTDYLDPMDLIIGVSGAQVTDEFMDRLLGKHIQGPYPVSLFAGMMDSFLAQSIAHTIQQPKDTVLPIPSRVGNLFRSH